MSEHPITFPSGGEQIVGVLHLPESIPAPAVVFCHGFTGNKCETHRIYVQTARALAREGIATLRFDFRGAGDSGGESAAMTIRSQVDDAREALRYVRDRDEIDEERLGLLGMSMGGMIAIEVLKDEPSVRTGVLWCAVADTVGAIRRKGGAGAAGQLAVKGVFDLEGWAVGREFVQELAATHPLKSIKQCRMPLLLIHGDQDESVPIDDAYAFRDILAREGTEHELRVIKGADHTFSSLPWTQEVIGTSRSWLVEHLKVDEDQRVL